MGCVVTPTHDPPDPDRVACVRADLAVLSTPAPAPLWTTEGAESKLGAGKLSVYRTGVAAGAGWMAVADGNAAAFTDAHELRWDAALGARVAEDSEDDEDAAAPMGGSGDGKRRDRRAFALSAEGPWTPAGSRALGGVAVAATFAGGAGSVVVVDRRAGCVRARRRSSRATCHSRSRRGSCASTAVARCRAPSPPPPPPPRLRRRARLAGGGGFSSRSASSRWRAGASPGARSTSSSPRGTGTRARCRLRVALPRRAAPRGLALGRALDRRPRPRRGRQGLGLRRQLGHAVASAARVAQEGLNATRRRRWTRRRALIGDDSTRSDASASSVDGVTSWRGATSATLSHDLSRDAGFATTQREVALPLGCGDALAGEPPTSHWTCVFSATRIWEIWARHLPPPGRSSSWTRGLSRAGSCLPPRRGPCPSAGSGPPPAKARGWRV